MGQNITTFNVDELITSYIDNQISDPELRKQIEEALNKDEKLFKKYQAEIFTKNIYASRLDSAEVPEVTYAKVMDSIDALISRSKQIFSTQSLAYPSFTQSLKNTVNLKFLGVPRYAYAAVLVFAIIAAAVVLNSSTHATKNPYILAGTEKSIMVQAVNVFHKVLSGDVKCQLKSGNATEVEKYVSDNANFKAYIPVIENYKLEGCLCDEYNGQKLAHLIYMNGEEIIYIYQTPVAAVQKNSLELPGAVHDEIVKAKYYMCDEIDENDCTMTLWYIDNIICASVTTLPKQKMHAAFTSFNK
ncbi:MAG: hypothetical protein L0Y77_00565 [Chlorobi bacterium]|nr:hypothetical protein [Chlorobiota bacterium]